MASTIRFLRRCALLQYRLVRQRRVCGTGVPHQSHGTVLLAPPFTPPTVSNPLG
ncbi:hypothetical protein RKD23_001266 [Streptomyces sp. SAI-170]